MLARVGREITRRGDLGAPSVELGEQIGQLGPNGLDHGLFQRVGALLERLARGAASLGQLITLEQPVGAQPRECKMALNWPTW